MRAHLQPGARLYTDEAAAYRGLSDYRHASVHHGGGEYGRGPVHTNGIESFWALFKRGFRGTYHSMSPKHLHRYAREFEGRHNHKADSVLQHRACLVQGMVWPAADLLGTDVIPVAGCLGLSVESTVPATRLGSVGARGPRHRPAGGPESGAPNGE